MTRSLQRTLLVLACAWAGWGHSCHSSFGHHHCHDHDRDGHCDDDHHHAGGGDGEESQWSVGGWTLIEHSQEAGRHPVERVLGVTGARVAGSALDDADALLAAAAEIVAANPELLGLPAEGFVPFGLHHDTEATLVALVQVAGGLPVPGGEGTLRFDLDGRLVEIVNRGWVYLP